MARDKTSKLMRSMKKGTPTKNIPLGIGVEIPDLSGVASNRKVKIENLTTSLAANRIPYSDGTNLTSSSNFTYNGLDFEVKTQVGANALHIVHASDSILIGNSQIGFYGHAAVPQPNPIIDAVGGATVDNEARTAINALLAACRASGFIAP